MTTPPYLPSESVGAAVGTDYGSDARLAPLVTSLAARLGAVCRDWNAAEFDALVERIARTKLGWADRGYRD